MKLVVGLGNPGSKYQGTRHNIGFELVDRLAQGGSRPSFSRKFDGLLAEIEIDFRRVLLLKPETFMNLSGRSVGQAVRFYKLRAWPTSWSSATTSACPWASCGSGRAGPTAVRKACATSPPTSAPTSFPASGSASATARRSTPPTSSSAGSAAPNDRSSTTP